MTKGSPALHTTDWSTSAALQSLLSSAIGGALFCVTAAGAFATVVHTTVPKFPARNISLDLQSLSWMADLRLRVEQVEPAPEVRPRIEKQTREALTEREIVRPMYIPVAIPAKPMKPRLHAEAKAEPRAPALADRDGRIMAEAPVKLPKVTMIEDKIELETAVPIRYGATEPSRELFEAAERERLRTFRAQLRGSFVTALNTPQREIRELAIQDIQLPDSPEFLPDQPELVDTQPVASAREEILPDPPEAVAVLHEADVKLDQPPLEQDEVKVAQAAPARPIAVKRVHKKKILRAKSVIAVSMPTTPLSKDMHLAKKPVETVPETRPTIRLMPKSATTPMIRLDNQSKTFTPEIEKVVATPQGAQIEVRVRPEFIGPPPSYGPEAPLELATQPTPEVKPTTPIVVPVKITPVMPAGQIVAMTDYSNGVGYSRTTPAGIVVTTRPVAPQATQAAVQGPFPLQGPQPPLLKVGPEPETTVELPPAPITGKALVHSVPFVEAFDWASPVNGVETEALTVENPEGIAAESGRTGWNLAKASKHLPTLYWLNGKSAPLISSNAAILLSHLASSGLMLQSETGIVFGRVPSGWSVEISGRAEHPVLLTDKNQVVSAQSIDGDRFFTFLNTEPGAHLVYLVGALGKPNGAVAVPVLPGTASYLDLSIVMKKSVSGRVLDAEATSPKALKGAQVRVVGQSSATAVTNDRGEFSISNVSVISNYPLFVETDAATGFTHRYRVASGHERELMLFRMGEKQVSQWLEQLEGGISSTSGIIVAAVPKPVGLNAQHAVFPAAESLAVGATLKPETYTVSSSGQLQINTPLKPESARFVTVQVPEGPTIVRLEDQRQAMVWSELVVSQPGIVNVVSAY